MKWKKNWWNSFLILNVRVCFFSQTAGHRAQFWFATGGAGFCISRPLVQKMAPVIRNEKLMTISDRIGFPDDVTIGFIIGNDKTVFFYQFFFAFKMTLFYDCIIFFYF